MTINETERQRRRTLVYAHMAVENAHDVDGVMKTFAEDTEMIFNGLAVRDHKVIHHLHSQFAFSAEQSAIQGTTLVVDREHFTDDEIVIEGRLCGKHVADWGAYPASGRDVELPYVAFYRFDGDDKLSSERVVMDFGTLLQQPNQS
jgi:hypothetical protein